MNNNKPILINQIQKIRDDFPILHEKVNGKPLVYFDNAATTQKPLKVINELSRYYSKINSNVHRGVHSLSVLATDEFDLAREKVANFINAKNPEDIVFVRGATEAINLIKFAWASHNILEGDEILITGMEHHSNLVPWQMLAKEKKCKLNYVKLTESGTLDFDSIKSLINSKTKLFAFSHISNVLGTINPVKKLVNLIHDVGGYALVDGAQSVPHLPVDVSDLNCDFFVASGHKMIGPTGVGFLYVSDSVKKQIKPFHFGGEMVEMVEFEDTTWKKFPYFLEAGTPDIAGVIGLGYAIDYLETLGMENIDDYERYLTEYALKVLEPFEKKELMTIFGPKDIKEKSGIISFQTPIHPHDLGTYLDSQGIAIRVGHHCAMPLTRQILKVNATTRMSFYFYNTIQEIDFFVASLKNAYKYFA